MAQDRGFHTITHEGSSDPVVHNIAEHRRIWRSGWSEEYKRRTS